LTAPDLPLNEQQRLAALRALELLDTEAEERFDRITRLATALFDVPIAAVSLVDAEREWFKSCQGLNTTEGPRSTSFCGHTILDQEPLVIEDAGADPRFAGNPQVIEDGIRFYAGVPIRAVDRSAVGAFCIKDRVPRRLTGEQLARLRDLAGMAEAELNLAEVTELRALLEESASERRRLEDDREQFFELSLDMLCIADFEGNFQQLNPAWEHTLGYSRAELRAQPFIELVHPDDQESTLSEAKALAEGQVCLSFENRYRHREGGYRWLHWSASASPERGLIYAVARDVTDLKHIEAQLRAAKEEAETASRTKSEFLANMSHELRTPLNSVIGFSAVLLENRAGNLGPADLQFLERIKDGGEHLLELINDVLDISKIEAGKLELAIDQVELESLVRATVPQFESLAGDKGVSLEVEAPDGASAKVEADPMRLKQVLLNLVGNAVKFTPDGTVTVRVVVGSGGNAQAVEVEDTGIGIPADKLSRIFDSFQQAETSTSRRFGGTGLGLTISRRLCRLMGFDLTAASIEGEGSTFRIELRPDSVPESDSASTFTGDVGALTGPTTGPLVLVIDDEVDSRMLLSDTISELGCRVTTAPSVEEGVRLARELGPDLITLDLMMPGMDGWEGLRLLKSDPVLGDTPVVVVSIVGRDHRRSLVGAAEVLDKPVDRRALESVLGDHLPAPGSRVFVVDAGGAGVEMKRVLERNGRKVEAAPVTDAIYDAIGDFDPELIVMAVGETNPASIGFLERIHVLPGFAEMPVVVVGAADLELSELRRVNSRVAAVVYDDADLASALWGALRQALSVA